MALSQVLTNQGWLIDNGTGATTGVNFGTPSSDRWIVICFQGDNPGGSITAITIGGVTASMIRDTSLGDIGFAYALVPTGTTGTITIAGAGPGYQIFGVWAVTGHPGITATAIDVQAVNNLSPIISCVSGGIIVGLAGDGAGGAYSLSFTSGITTQGTDFASNNGATSTRLGGGDIAVGGSITCSFTDTGPFALSVLASFEPVGSFASGAGSASAVGNASGVGRMVMSRAGAASSVAAAAGVGRMTKSAAGSASAVASAAASSGGASVATGSAAAVAAAVAGGASIRSAAGSASAVASAGAVVPTTVLNPLDKDATITISGAGLIATASGGLGGVRAVNSWSTGKHAFSFNGTYPVGGVFAGVGNSIASRQFADGNGVGVGYFDPFGWLGYTNDTGEYVDGTSTPPTGNDTVVIFCDSTNNLLYAYSADAGGYLFGGDPVAGTGGLPLPPGPHFPILAVDHTISPFFGTANFAPIGLPTGWTQWLEGNGAFGSAGNASVVASASANGTAIKTAAGTAASTATATGAGTALKPAAGSAAATTAAPGVGRATVSRAGSAAAIASASGAGRSTASSAGSASVTVAASGQSASGTIASATGSASSVANAVAVGSSVASSPSVAASTASASGVGRPIAAGAGTAAAAAGATAGGVSTFTSGGSGSALASAVAVGRSTAASAGTAAVVSAASGVSAAGSIAAGAGSASSVAFATASGSSVAASAGSAAVVVTSVIGAGVTIISRAGSAAVVSAAAGVAGSIVSRAANANVLTNGIAGGRAIAAGTGNAAVTTVALARSTFNLSTQPAALIV